MGEWVIATTLVRDYHRDPFPHSLLRNGEFFLRRVFTTEVLKKRFDLGLRVCMGQRLEVVLRVKVPRGLHIYYHYGI